MNVNDLQKPCNYVDFELLHKFYFFDKDKYLAQNLGLLLGTFGHLRMTIPGTDTKHPVLDISISARTKIKCSPLVRSKDHIEVSSGKT